MADDKRSPSGPPGGKRRRPPTTIDLKATEIASDPVNPSEPTDSTKETPPEAPAAASKAGESAPGPATAPPPGPGWRPEWLASAAMNDRLAALRARLAEQNWRVAGAGAAGAVAMLVLFLALWAFGSFGAPDRTAPLAARLATLESQLRDLAARPQPPAVDPKALADLTARVGAAEQAMARLADLDARVTDVLKALPRVLGKTALQQPLKPRRQSCRQPAPVRLTLEHPGNHV